MYSSELRRKRQEFDAALVDLFRKWREQMVLSKSDDQTKLVDVSYTFCDKVRWILRDLAPIHGLELGPLGDPIEEFVEPCPEESKKRSERAAAARRSEAAK